MCLSRILLEGGLLDTPMTQMWLQQIRSRYTISNQRSLIRAHHMQLSLTLFEIIGLLEDGILFEDMEATLEGFLDVPMDDLDNSLHKYGSSRILCVAYDEGYIMGTPPIESNEESIQDHILWRTRQGMACYVNVWLSLYPQMAMSALCVISQLTQSDGFLTNDRWVRSVIEMIESIKKYAGSWVSETMAWMSVKRNVVLQREQVPPNYHSFRYEISEVDRNYYHFMSALGCI